MEAKLDLLKAEKRWFELRHFATSQHRFFEGLEGMHGAEKNGSRAFSMTHIEYGVVALKKRLAWRDDDAERKETCSSGASLLFWAAAANDVFSVRELLRTGCKFVNRGLAKNTPELSACKNMTPLHAGMAFACWEVVELLLDGGADPMARDAKGSDSFMFASMFGKDANICSWVARFPDWNLERREVDLGLTALHFAAMFGTNKRPTIELLLLSGANPLAVADTGTSLLGFAASNPDLLPEEMQWLLHYNGKEICQHGLHLKNRPQTFKWRVVYAATRLLSRLGNTNKMVRVLARWDGCTPLHDAGQMGHHGLAGVLTAAGASTEARTAQGLTPLQLAHVSHGGEASKLLEKSTSFGTRSRPRFMLSRSLDHVPRHVRRGSKLDISH
jgi:ankyrin repeat protein